MILRLAILLFLPLAAAPAARADAIVGYCGGGVTGGGGGTRIESDGTVVRLLRRRPGTPAEESQLEDRSAPYARIAAMLDAADFVRMPRGAPSNMTCSITWLRNGQAHLVMWGIATTPTALRTAWQEIQAAGR